MPRTRTTPLILLALGGCGGPVVPHLGGWIYSDDGLIETTCADDLYRDPDATFAVVSADSAGFVATDGEEFECTIGGNTFSCPERRKADLPITGDTVVTWSVAVHGKLPTTHTMRGTQTFTITCAGSLCGLDQAALGYDLPCSYSVAFHAVAPL